MRSNSSLLLVFVCALLAVSVPVQENIASPTAASSPLLPRPRPLRFFENRQFHSADYEASSTPPRVPLKLASANRHQGPVTSRAILAEDSLQDGLSAKHRGDAHRDINWRVAKPKEKRRLADTHPFFESANDPNTNHDTQVTKSIDKNVAAVDDLLPRDSKVILSPGLINHNHHGDENKSVTGHRGHTSELGQAALNELDEYCED